MTGFLKILFGKILFLVLMLSLQALFFAAFFLPFLDNKYKLMLLTLGYTCTFFIAVHIICREKNTSYKLAWMLYVFLMPFFSIFLYYTLGRKPLNHKARARLIKIAESSKSLLCNNNADISLVPKKYSKISGLLEKCGGYPVYQNTAAEYYSDGKPFFEALLNEIKSAERYIFLDFYQLKDGKLLKELITLLKEKARQGLDIRLTYDAIGAIGKLKKKSKNEIRKAGIKLQSFNPALYSFNLNARNHQKIVVIDGHTAFTGGINVADAYINLTQPYGYLRDTAIKFKGAAAFSFCVMFLKMWNFMSENNEDYNNFKAENTDIVNSNSLIHPFSDGPHTCAPLNKNVFSHLINASCNSVYISTPYLILDDETLGEICNSARSGVDVRILTPHIPDKKAVFKMTRSFYAALIEAGVRVYEFTPGFNHSKIVISDSNAAYIGSCNLDYRSFYVQYECGAVLYNDSAVAQMQKDFLETLKKCQEIPYKTALKYGNPLVSLVSPLF